MTTSALALKPAVKTVVIADDSAFVRHRFKTALQNGGHRAVTVKSAAELLARVRADLAGIDLLVVDLRLPQGSGAELVRAIRRIDDGQIPILVFSGTISSADEIRALASLGVAGYVNSTAPCSTSCRRSRRTCSRTASTGGAARGWCSASKAMTFFPWICFIISSL